MVLVLIVGWLRLVSSWVVDEVILGVVVMVYFFEVYFIGLGLVSVGGREWVGMGFK